jgi:hypothetical protein
MNNSQSKGSNYNYAMRLAGIKFILLSSKITAKSRFKVLGALQRIVSLNMRLAPSV